MNLTATRRAKLNRINVGNYAYLEYEIVRTFKHRNILRLPYIMVEFLYTAASQRRQGHASKLLTTIKLIGDNLHMPVVVECLPYGEDKPTKDWLMKFYEKHGFTQTFFDYMEYKPKAGSSNLPILLPPPTDDTPPWETVTIPPTPTTQLYEAA